MPEVLEIEQTEIKQEENQASKIASWAAEIPANVIKELGLTEGSFVLLTYRDGKIQPEIVPPLSGKLKDTAEKILKKRKQLYEELRRVGD